MKKIIFYLVVVLGIWKTEVYPAILLVPSEYETIQAAIDAASNGDTIRASSGTYNEAIYINKPITLIGNETPTITSQSLGDTNTVTFDGANTNNASISGFIITGAKGKWPNGNGIYCKNNANPTITNNRFWNKTPKTLL